MYLDQKEILLLEVWLPKTNINTRQYIWWHVSEYTHTLVNQIIARLYILHLFSSTEKEGLATFVVY